MGIKNLHQFLKKKCPHVYQTVSLNKFKHKTIAVDLSIYLFKYKIIFGAKWLDAFLYLIANMNEKYINLIFVYDTKSPPEKEMERRLRSEARAKLKAKLDKIKNIWDQIKPKEMNVEDFVVPEIEDHVFMQFINRQVSINNTVSTRTVEEEIQKIENSLTYISSIDFGITKLLFHACGIPTMDAEGEAEATCAALNINNFVTGVLTDDTDVLAYSTPLMIYKLNFEEHTCIEIDYEYLLQELGLNREAFLDFCIMCGTDYNPTIPRIGCERAFKLIQEYGSIENIGLYNPTVAIDVLNYKRIREIFNYQLRDNTTIPDNQPPNKTELIEFCFRHNCQFDIRRIIKDLKSEQQRTKHVRVL
jgi:5'-3' exonuclease